MLDADALIPDKLSHIHAISGYVDEMHLAIRESVYAQLERVGSPVSVSEDAQPITWATRIYDEAWEGLPGYETRLEFIELKSQEFSNIGEVNDIIRGWLISMAHAERRVKFDQDPERLSFGQSREQRTNSWDASCTKVVVTGSTISILYAIWWYGAGAAHPNHYFKSFCFSLEPLVHIDSLQDIFKKPEDGLVSLQSYVRDYFLSSKDVNDETHYGKDWVCEGTSDWPSFSSFSFTADGIELFFPPYQLASYADGSKSVVVPYLEVLDLMDKNFQHLLGIAYLRIRLNVEGR